MLLHPLIAGPRKILRFYLTFFGAFLAYAVAWCAAWFAMGDRSGEWAGSAAGCVAFTLVLALTFGNWRSFIPAAVVLFITHTAGYFAGSSLYIDYLHQPQGCLLWGVAYGLGFGAGIGYAYWAMQRHKGPQ